MKLIKNRVNAFTMLELVVVMLISAIVIGITYTAYTIMSQGYLKFTQKSENTAVLLRIDELFRKDFAQSERITFDGNNFLFIDSLRMTKYEIKPDYVVRNAVAIDTFKVKFMDLSAYFSNKLVHSTEAMPDTGQLIDELSFKLSAQSDTIVYHYHKTYSSQNLIKNTAYAIN